jgi:sugar phosphate isomerase/epimerase
VQVSERLCLLSSAFLGAPPAEIAAAASGAGITSIEWGVGPEQAAGPRRGDEQQLRALSESHGLTVAGVIVQGGKGSLADTASLRPVMELAAGLGAGYVRVFAPASRGGPFADELQAARDEIARAVELAVEHGLALLIETAPATLAPSTTLARALVEGHDPARAGVLWDPANGVIEGLMPSALAIAELGPYLQQVHIKNISWHRSGGRWEWRYATLAGGQIDWTEVLAAVAAAGYDGRFCIDHMAVPATAPALRREAARVRALLAATIG